MLRCTDTSHISSAICNALDNNEYWEDSARFQCSTKQMFANSIVISTVTAMLIPLVALGVSGGGLDYANLDISSQNFSGGNYKGKDFTQGS
jgi:hypothetical protein